MADNKTDKEKLKEAEEKLEKTKEKLKKVKDYIDLELATELEFGLDNPLNNEDMFVRDIIENVLTEVKEKMK
jgi:hypothetical protein